MRTVKILLSELELDNAVPPKNRKFGRAKAVEDPQVFLSITPEKRNDEGGDKVYGAGGDWLRGSDNGDDISIHISLDVGYGQEAVRNGMQQMKELEGLVKETVEKLSRGEPGSRFDNWRVTYEHIQ